jgi:hypothetical protein
MTNVSDACTVNVIAFALARVINNALRVINYDVRVMLKIVALLMAIIYTRIRL